MPYSVSFFILAAALFRSSLAGPQLSGKAITGRYWDCCKPSCGWKDKADFNNPIQSCDIHDKPLSDYNAGTGCNTGGTAYACSNQSPWNVSETLSYGFIGAYLVGGEERDWCSACYQLNFTSGPGDLTNKTMIVQATNTDYDVLSDNMFTFSVSGGILMEHSLSCAS
jgi:hypothetical protein